MIRRDPIEPRDEEQVELLAQLNAFLRIWEKQFRAAGYQCEWDSLPTIDTTTGCIWFMVPSRVAAAWTDRWQAYIYGVKDGKRYFRAVEITGRERENGAASEKLIAALNAVQRLGPSVCTAVEDGGDLPRPEDQVELDATRKIEANIKAAEQKLQRESTAILFGKTDADK